MFLLSELIKKPIKEVTFYIKSISELEKISQFLSKNGETLIKINYEDKDKNYSFKLENKRNLDRKSLNLLINKEISAIIN